MTDDGWTQYLVFRHEGILKDEALSAFTKEIYASIISRSNGSWKPISVELDDNEIRIKCKYIEGETYNG